MFRVSKHVEIDAGHRVPYHDSKCQHLHGHRYRITLTAEAPETVPADVFRSDSGMVVDFGTLKQVLIAAVHDPYDHKLILWTKDPLIVDEEITLKNLHPVLKDSIIMVPCVPTAEELARFWGHLCLNLLAGSSFDLYSCEVRETPTSIATYYFPS